MPSNKYVPKSMPYAKVYQHALELFGYDKDKTNVWWMSPINELEGASPFEMVKSGRGRELMKLINRCR